LETWSDEEFAAVAQKELDYQPLRVLVPTLRIALPSSKLYPDQRDPEKLENFRTRAEASFDMLRTQMPWTHRVMLRMSASRRSREHQVSSPTDCFYVAEDKAIKDPRAWTDWTSGMRRGSLSMRQHGLAS
jgi:hypothetical protein